MRLWSMATAAILATAILTPGLAIAGDVTTTVKFRAGASSATLKGTVKGYDTARYIIGAEAGQVMSVLFSPGNSSCYFNVLPPSGGDAVFNGSSSGNEYSANLQSSGNYTIQTYLMRNAARRNETCKFSLTIEIGG
ncbi:hypothetical protein [Pararhizobium sp.]|uniref:hypothetical protein n=1 Tax=Pararhizobium sp. TaxID=1977563 RepID=UPI002722A312|nr:hypothetical protein [Pararhizobium sp.]MDO9414676.1 hypothetical protein [Pararhizobium sp.]